MLCLLTNKLLYCSIIFSSTLMPTTEPHTFSIRSRGILDVSLFFFSCSLSYLAKLKMSRSATHALLRLSKPFEGLPRDLRFASFFGGRFLFNTQSPGTVVGTLTTVAVLDDTGVDLRQGQEITPFTETSIPTLGPTLPPMQWAPSFLSGSQAASM